MIAVFAASAARREIRVTIGIIANAKHVVEKEMKSINGMIAVFAAYAEEREIRTIHGIIADAASAGKRGIRAINGLRVR